MVIQTSNGQYNFAGTTRFLNSSLEKSFAEASQQYELYLPGYKIH
jgi:hypothetical protein